MNNTVQINKSSEEKIKELHRKRLLELSLKSLGEIPQLEGPDEEQQEWINRKMRRFSW